MGWLFGRKKETQDASEMLRRYNEAESARLAAMVGGSDSATAGTPTLTVPSATLSAAGEPGAELAVEDVFTITGRGLVVTGKVVSGTMRVGDQVVVLRGGAQQASARVTGIEMLRRSATEAATGASAGLLLAGKHDIVRGDIVRTVPSA
ncbi:hypothetical protein J2Y69_003295 [Microbacterium resistens]|uniref:Translation elongation factor EFTu-like domain-containing protein n=1 Tax=Microbacterium resistens TaxID=156977 RepID=A0ABU1SGF6_9MICO|nr:EF-Tu/IF-2/RF-3 family GTPase [Microbacterium resistens]MDR6868671.1 hypothetical protein [Microbacterium resistens]